MGGVEYKRNKCNRVELLENIYGVLHTIRGSQSSGFWGNSGAIQATMQTRLWD
jgi:hypothetical protein